MNKTELIRDVRKLGGEAMGRLNWVLHGRNAVRITDKTLEEFDKAGHKRSDPYLGQIIEKAQRPTEEAKRRIYDILTRAPTLLLGADLYPEVGKCGLDDDMGVKYLYRFLEGEVNTGWSNDEGIREKVDLLRQGIDRFDEFVKPLPWGYFAYAYLTDPKRMEVLLDDLDIVVKPFGLRTTRPCDLEKGACDHPMDRMTPLYGVGRGAGEKGTYRIIRPGFLRIDNDRCVAFARVGRLN